MSKLILFSMVGVAVLAVALYFYVAVVREHLSIANFALDKDGKIAEATGFIAKVNAHLLNLKTVILAFIASAVQAFVLIPPEVMGGWKDLPWAQVFDAKVANWVTIICTILIPIVHAQGLARAAVAPPADPTA